MRVNLARTVLRMLVAAVALAGCGPSKPEVTVPSKGPDGTQLPINPEQASPRVSDGDAIPTENLGAILEAHQRGLGHTDGYDYPGAVDAFREVHRLAPGWTPGTINLALALFYSRNTARNDPRREVLLEESSGLKGGNPGAIALLNEVLSKDPENVRARFCRGLVYLSVELVEKAHADFQFVVDHDPDDAHAWFWLARTETDLTKKITALQKAVDLNPFLRPALYQLAVSHMLNGDRAARRNLLARWSNLDPRLKPGASGMDAGLEYYGEAGKYGEFINPAPVQGQVAEPYRAPRFDSVAPLKVHLGPGDRWATLADFTGPTAVLGRARARLGAPIATFDANEDGRLDLYLPAAIKGSRGLRDALLLNRGEGVFDDVTVALGLPPDRASLGVAVGDFDADGHVDLFLTGVGDNRLYRKRGTGPFEDVTTLANVATPSALSPTARWLDLDQDGDLDLYVVNYATLEQVDRAFTGQSPTGTPNAVFRNDGKPKLARGRPEGDLAPRAVAPDGYREPEGLSLNFSPWTDAGPLLGGTAPHTGIAWLDLDGDRDLDLVLSADGIEPQSILNDRLGQFHATGIQGMGGETGSSGLLVTDLDKDGQSDLVTLGTGGVHAWKNRTKGSGAKHAIEFERWPSNVREWRCAQAADLDLDGWPDLLGLPTASAMSLPSWTRNDGRRLTEKPLPVTPENVEPITLEGVTLADIVGDLLPDIVMLRDGKGPSVARNLGNGHHWLSLALNGRWASFGHLRTNPHGNGAKVWLQGPGLNTTFDLTTVESGLAQSIAPSTLGLGRSESAAMIRIRWPDGVSQCELNVPADQKLRLNERTHRVSTCPILFTWDGARHVCVCDLLAGGGLGYYLAPGVWSEPDRDEAIMITSDQLKPVDGVLRLAIAEPMDETAYLDRLTLDVVDRPPGTTVAPDERFTAGPPAPTGELLAWKTSIDPVRATDLRGNDLTEILRSTDRRTVDGFQRLEGWNGYTEEHGIVLDFGDRLSRFNAKDRLILGLSGWVEYPFSQTNYGAASAGVALRLPVLERQREDGSWEVIEANAGCAAGLSRLTTLNVAGKLNGSRCVLRLRTNLECYWDQAFIAVLDLALPVHVTSLEVARADLVYRGYMREVSPDGRLPCLYDYDSIVAMPLARISGRLTRYGDVSPLLHTDDDQLCLVGPGDEVRIEFDARSVPPLSPGWSRCYVLRAVGYCKDSDLSTAAGDRVGPLPWRGMPSYPFGESGARPQDEAYREYLKRYQTRPAGIAEPEE